ncbi:esterase-like activity of phytase family protein [soil metagenome]
MKIVLKTLATIGLIAVAACAGVATTVPLDMGEAGYSIRMETRQVPLGVAGAVLAAGVSYAGGLSLHGANLHGLSDLKLDGDQAWSVSDFGAVVRFRILLDAGGRLVGADAASMRRLVGPDGAVMQSKAAADSEGLALLNGAVVVSFERDDRIWSYGPRALDLPTPLRRPEVAFPPNEGMEGLAAAPDGGWLALGEGGGAWVCNISACRVLPNAPAVVTDGFMLTSADVDPNGGWFILQRRYSPPFDMRAQVRRMAPDGTLGPVLISLRAPASVDNMEGLAVQATPEGVRLYILSDDNDNPLEKTLLLAFDAAE